MPTSLSAQIHRYILGFQGSFESFSLHAYLLAAFVGLICIGLGAAIGYYIFHVREGLHFEERLQQVAKREAERARNAERKRLHVVYHLISALTSSLKYQLVLDQALDLGGVILGTPNSPADRLVSAVLLFSDSHQKPAELTIGSARRFTPADMRIVLPGTSGLTGQVIESGEACLSRKIAEDPELSRIVAIRTCSSVYCIPLRSGLETYGLLLYAHPEGDYFTPDRREILEIVAKQAVIAIQNALLYQDLEQEKERMLEIQEEARKKLARDLHDGPTQAVAAIAMRVNFARRLMERDGKATAEELYKIEDLARRTTKEIRHMLFTLRPLVLESQGLIPALEAMADKMHETYSQNVIIEGDQHLVPDLEMGKQAVIFYIIEEAVNNARKHAQAAHIWVRLKQIENQLALLEIEDDGVGFNVGAVDAFYDKRGSLGMVNMRERAELVNGIMRIDSVEGQGTIIQVVIPLNEEAADRLRSRS
jgi:signal transduction histidine kinase